MTPELATVVVLLVLATAVLTEMSHNVRSESERERLNRRVSMPDQDVERQRMDDLWRYQ